MLKSAEEMAQMYQDAIAAIVGGGANVQYSIQGKSFSKSSLTRLERLFHYWRGQAAKEAHGNSSVADFGGGNW